MTINIKWMRRGAQRITHAFREAEVERFHTAMPLGLCDEFKVADLVEDPTVSKCTRCERAIRRIEREQRRTALKGRLQAWVGDAARAAAPAPSARTTRSAA